MPMQEYRIVLQFDLTMDVALVLLGCVCRLLAGSLESHALTRCHGTAQVVFLA